jgi:hypothetical protein
MEDKSDIASSDCWLQPNSSDDFAGGVPKVSANATPLQCERNIAVQSLHKDLVGCGIKNDCRVLKVEPLTRDREEALIESFLCAEVNEGHLCLLRSGEVRDSGALIAREDSRQQFLLETQAALDVDANSRNSGGWRNDCGAMAF